ncbi:putative carnitine/acylcarnitine carrier protein [Dictyocaulus viviparus]|uniref:Mitochondrial basic amino acids transporter n=1 Tax=Dictyocaulus viviparus TaxID=29172 RepID=A0A0D8XQU5_DICVI|nr:putative carnitine/acylcarnitine carrier protein [Dictyocaulus viviparus]
MSALDFFAGCLGGAAGVLAGHPLDTVKVRLQMQHAGSKLYRGTWHCFKTIVHKEGISGLYKGISSPLASLTAINAIVFGVHGSVSRDFAQPDSIMAHFCAGSAAGMMQSVIATPSERLKLLMQIQTDEANKRYQSPLHAARSLVKNHGHRTLFRGFLATLCRDCPAFGIYFASYEWMSRHMSKDGQMESLTGPQLLLAGGGAGILSWLFNYPTDVVKTRFQAGKYENYLHCIQTTYLQGGLRAFYIGLGSTLLRAFPSNAATFFTVEWTYRLLLDFNVLDIGSSTEKRLQVDEEHSTTIAERLSRFMPAIYMKEVHASDNSYCTSSQSMLFID